MDRRAADANALISQNRPNTPIQRAAAFCGQLFNLTLGLKPRAAVNLQHHPGNQTGRVRTQERRRLPQIIRQ